MAYPPNCVPEYWDTLIGGMDAGRRPTLITQDRYALGINVTVRGGVPKTRPAWINRPITFETQEEETWFRSQLYQGAKYYVPRSGGGQILVSVGGRIWSIDLCAFLAQEVTPGGPYGRSNRCEPFAYFCQAEQYMVIQNGKDLPIIYDGGVSRRSNGTTEIPTGTIMAYGQGRIWMMRGDTLIAGDIDGGPTSVIDFTERQVLAEGGDLRPSYTIGPVMGLEFVPQQDTTTGQGNLIVRGSNGCISVFAEKPRLEWKSGIARVTLVQIGGTGHRSSTGFNGDLWFRATDGWRAYRQARAEIQNWAQVPLSTEVQPFIDSETPWLLPYASSIRFNNRLLTTTSPRVQNGRVTFQGLLSIDFQILSQLGSSTNPAWDGLWTGANFLELIQSGTQAFAFTVNEDGEINLVEILPDHIRVHGDSMASGDRQIQCRVDTRVYSYKDSKDSNKDAGMFSLNKLISGSYHLQDIVGPWSIEHFYRPYGATCWSSWDTRSGCVSFPACRETGLNAPNYRSGIQIGLPQNPRCDTPDRGGAGNSGLEDSVGYGFQFSHRWAGNLAQVAFISVVKLQPDQESDMIQCRPEPEGCVSVQACCEDFFAYTPAIPEFFLPNVTFNPSQAVPGEIVLVSGCNDPTAINYDPRSNLNDGSCLYDAETPTTPTPLIPPSSGTPRPPPGDGGCRRNSDLNSKCYDLN